MRRHPSRILASSTIACALGVCLAVSAHAVVRLPSAFRDEIRIARIDRPTSLAFLPDGRLLVSEQFTGNIRIAVEGVTLLQPPVLVQGDLNINFERGLLSVAVDPGWPARPYLYVDYTSPGGIRLIRYTGSGALDDSLSGALTFGDPYVVLDSLPDVQTNHNGGTVKFGPDGMLYMSLGDDGRGCPAQDSTSMLGCILRLDVSSLPPGPGGPPPRRSLSPLDNPWHAMEDAEPDSNASLVFAYGFRNPFRFQFDSLTGQVYVGDPGDDSWEELDAPVAGSNAGWPYREGYAFVNYPGCGEPGGMGADRFLDPIDWYPHTEGLAIIAAGVFRASAKTSWPSDLDGTVFYADWWSGMLRAIRHVGSIGWVRLQQVGTQAWGTGLQFPVDFAWGPDGNLWWLSDQDSTQQANTGSLHRIVYGAEQLAVAADRAELCELAALPNPWRSHADLSFRLPRASNVRLEIFDLAGRRLTTLIDEPRAAGIHTVRWPGAGNPSAGLCFARLTWDGGSSTLRLVRMR